MSLKRRQKRAAIVKPRFVFSTDAACLSLFAGWDRFESKVGKQEAVIGLQDLKTLSITNILLRALDCTACRA